MGISVAVRIPEDQYALLIAGPSRIALMGRETPRANDRVSLAFEVGDLAAVEASLTAAGAEFRRVEDHPDGLKMVTTTDPDGIGFVSSAGRKTVSDRTPFLVAT